MTEQSEVVSSGKKQTITKQRESAKLTESANAEMPEPVQTQQNLNICQSFLAQYAICNRQFRAKTGLISQQITLQSPGLKIKLLLVTND